MLEEKMKQMISITMNTIDVVNINSIKSYKVKCNPINNAHHHLRHAVSL